MAAPLDQKSYPKYFKTDNALLAFLGPSDMYKIENIGSNKNEGVCIDHYITRKMVISHWNRGLEITKAQFAKHYQDLFSAVGNKIF